jgi:hypothetical protein
VTKDRDFEVSHFLRGAPSKLLLVTAGDITNRDLAALLSVSLVTITDADRSRLCRTDRYVRGDSTRTPARLTPLKVLPGWRYSRGYSRPTLPSAI